MQSNRKRTAANTEPRKQIKNITRTHFTKSHPNLARVAHNSAILHAYVVVVVGYRAAVSILETRARDRGVRFACTRIACDYRAPVRRASKQATTDDQRTVLEPWSSVQCQASPPSS